MSVWKYVPNRHDHNLEIGYDESPALHTKAMSGRHWQTWRCGWGDFPAERSCGCNRPPQITRGRCGRGSANLWGLARSAGLHPTPCSVLGCAADRHRCRTATSYQNPPTTQAETSGIPQNVASSRGWNPLRSRRSRMAHTPLRSIPARPVHLANHAPKPTRIKSPALAVGAPAGREQVIRSR